MQLTSLAIFIFGTVMCWSNDLRKITIFCWLIWGIGVLTLPVLTGNSFLFTALQSVLALTLVLRWKFYTTMP